MIQNATYYIDQLKLQAHPEGGYFKETYRSSGCIDGTLLREQFSGERNYSTAIYYLLQQGDFSAYHRIKSDECWHFYAGGTLLIHVIHQNEYSLIKLGTNLSAGECFQYVVPAGAWFASEPAADSPFSLVGCTVAPGFDFSDFEMADRKAMLYTFPQYSDSVTRLCRQ